MTDEPIRILASSKLAPLIRKEVTRRRLLSLGATGAGAAFLAACSSGGQQAATEATGGDLEDSLSIYSWGDYDDPALLDAFQEEFGPKLRIDSFGSNEELIAKLVASKGTGGYDIIVPTGDYIPQMVENGLLMELNHDLIPNIEHMDPAFLDREWDPGNKYSICKAWGTAGFVYDVTKIDRELTTWNDFIDCAQNEASGSTTVLDDPMDVTGIYYWANEIDWNTTDEKHLDDCENFIVNELAPHISAFDSYPGSGGAITQGSAALIQAWNGDARMGILESSDPDKWKWVLPGPDTELWMDNWSIVSSAPHPEAAHAFLNYILDPEVQVQNTEYIGYHTGAKGIEETAREEGFEMIDLIFFTEEQIATMHEGVVTEATERNVDIYNKAKAAASA